MKRLILMIALCGICSVVWAEPEPLVIDKKVKRMANKSAIAAVHQEMETHSKGIAAIRLAIIEGMLNTKGRAWVFEGEGDGYILARFDYRGHVIVMRVEYNSDLVQLKYHGSSEAYICDALFDDGICYKNHKNYFNYTRNFRTSIERELLADKGI